MNDALFGSDLWRPALDKYAESAGMTVQLFDGDGKVVLLASPTPLFALFRECGFEPGLFSECARRCLEQTDRRPAVVVAELHGLAVVGTSLVLEGEVVGAAVAGYALKHLSQVATIQAWAEAADVPFERLWNVMQRQPAVSERRLSLHGELLQVLGDALLRENYRTRQYEDAVIELRAAAAAKDEFLAVLSHELRTPLTAILNWAAVLKSDRGDHRREASEAIERNVLLESRMIDDLLDITRIARGNVKLTMGGLALPTVVHAALETCDTDIKRKEIRVEFAYDAAEWLCVEGDTGRLQQVFRNLVSNAVKFTPAGGGIRVALGREGAQAVAVVADTGVGIDPEFLPFVFDIFRQQEQGTRREHAGLGIGLAVVKRLVELHDGTVKVKSAGAGTGTEVTVRLPLAPKTSDLVASAPSRLARPSALAGVSVLIIDDDEDARGSLARLLELLGAVVSTATNGRQALDMMATTALDVVLCDLRMPRMDGYEFIAELNRATSHRHPPIVAVSGLVSEDDRTRTRESGFAAHIGKPFNAADLAAVVDETIHHP